MIGFDPIRIVVSYQSTQITVSDEFAFLIGVINDGMTPIDAFSCPFCCMFKLLHGGMVLKYFGQYSRYLFGRLAGKFIGQSLQCGVLVCHGLYLVSWSAASTSTSASGLFSIGLPAR
jgi:hypothetical protein